MNSLTKNILITGCSSGIGYCVAHELKKRGYRVFATARKMTDVIRLQTEGLESLQLDLANSNSIQTAVTTVLERTEGKLYALFNNGAYGQAGAVEDLSRAVLREQFETNLFGTHELTCAVLPTFLQQGEGRILQNSSLLGYVALPMRGAYNASKHALEGLSDTLRLELKGTGIHICLIEPGPIATHFRENSLAMFKQNINIENSRFKEHYQTTIKRLETKGAAVPFTLPPNAVFKKVLHALEAKNPKTHYPVTFPSYLFATLKRILTPRALDKILNKVG